ncbi:uncharacterized protein LOC123311774 isoform X1 [Coccinella septempunctata]|uniref:uncharacterized protein LOC123311774 isoform X1 n=2 Tax=Coccinella septempunctata TaxID=41139 RepID=UPI001D09624F|nr:uncharacterized protein LOC123311774 isoform X1 [Coccinella septempunctata]
MKHSFSTKTTIMPNLDLIESRIAALEREILGIANNGNTDDLKTTVTDSLIQAHTMISSALSCRDSITAVMDRMAKVDEYLDPLYVVQMIDVECKMTYVLEMHEKLKENYESLKALDKLLVILNSENINRLIDNDDRIKLALIENFAINQERLKTVENVIKVLVGYNDMMKNIKLLFRQMNLLLTNLESGQEQTFKNEE